MRIDCAHDRALLLELTHAPANGAGIRKMNTLQITLTNHLSLIEKIDRIASQYPDIAQILNEACIELIEQREQIENFEMRLESEQQELLRENEQLLFKVDIYESEALALERWTQFTMPDPQ
jgi:hypothetical protein